MCLGVCNRRERGVRNRASLLYYTNKLEGIALGRHTSYTGRAAGSRAAGNSKVITLRSRDQRPAVKASQMQAGEHQVTDKEEADINGSSCCRRTTADDDDVLVVL